MIRKALHALLALIGLIFAAFLAYQGYVLLRLWWWTDHNPASTAFMDSRLAVLREKKPEAKLKHQWVPYGKISSHLKRAILAAEDDKFIDHEGFDWEGMQKAMEKNQKKGKVVAVGSTLSQRLAKNLVLSGDGSRFGKDEEASIPIRREW